ncbi:MAG: paraquat-inducible protein A [Phycisphaerales bacterium]|nr:paraquat-inducible protein A [Phycisphaerales bacterium]
MPAAIDEHVSCSALQTCPCCGLAQTVPSIPPRTKACCARCGTKLISRSAHVRSSSRTAAIAAAALIIYPFAITLPMLRIEELGYHSEASILEGVATLLGSGELFVGIIVLLCSVIIPLTKLVSLLLLSAGGVLIRRDRHRALTYHLVEWTGRWGMLDVLLVAILVAVLKLGDIVEVSAGPAALAFCACVILSLLASASFDPRSLWRAQDHLTTGGFADGA